MPAPPESDDVRIASDAPLAPDPAVEHNASHWITRWAAACPDRLAWADDERRCDYATAEDRIGRLARWLAEAGVSRGERVALWLGNRGATLEALFAAARLGAIALPINARLTAEEVAFQLDDASPRVLLVETAWRGRAEDALRVMHQSPPRCLEVGRPPEAEPSGATSHSTDATDAYEAAIGSTPPSAHCEPVRPDDPMLLMYTSGTTGKPKGALLPHRKALYNALNAELYFEIRGEDRVLVVAPLFHSLGLQILALPAIHAGASLVIQDGFDAARVWSTIERESISYFGGVPTMHARLLDALDRGDPLRAPPACLRFAFTAGAAAPPELIRGFDRHGLLLKQGYGQTETSILTCLDGELALTKAGSVGRPVRHGEIRLILPATIEGPVEDWRDAAVGEVGEIVVRGPITMLEYWQRPEATAETLRGEWLRTGDLATRDEDFDVTLVGRAREMFISGGENVYPAEIEATLLEHPDIEEAAVVAVTDPEWGEVGRAHLVARADVALNVEEIAAWLGTRLARFKQPREFVLEPALPRTASGKIQKHRLQPHS